MTFSGPIGALIEFAIGGGWGLEIPKDNHSRVAVIRGTDIPRITAGDFTSVPFRYESDKKIVNRILSPGDIVLETAGGSSANGQYTGRTLLITQEILDVLGPTICASFCKKLVLKKDLVHPKYFYYYMQDLYKSGRVAAYDSQSTGISNFQYEAFINNEYLELPSMHMQTASATLLSIVQEKITENTRITKTLEDIAQAIFKSWFIDFDPVKAKMNGEKPIGMDDETAALFPDSFEESQLGLIPKGWKTINLSDIAYIFQGKYVKPSELNLTRNVDFPTPVEGATKSIGFTNKSTFQFDYPTVSCRGSCGYVRWISSPAWISNNLMAIYSKEQELYNYYLYFLMKTINFENITTGSVQGQITIGNLAPTKLIYQPEIVKTFSELVEPFQKTIMKLEYQSKLYADVRDSLLPRLISGELEIPEEMLAS